MRVPFGVILLTGILGVLWVQAAGIQQILHPKPESLSAKKVAKMSDVDLEIAVFELLLKKYPVFGAEDAARFRRMNQGQQMLVATMECENEVNNGGFVQYYWNGEGYFAKAAVKGFRLIGATRHAKIVEAAIAVHSKEAPRLDRLKRIDTKQSFSDAYKESKLNDLDQQYYKTDAGENVAKLHAQYIRAHLKDFGIQ